MVSDELPADRIAAEVPSLSGRGLQSGMPHAVRPDDDAMAGGRRDLAAPLAGVSAGRTGEPPRHRRKSIIPERSALARLDPVPRVLPRRDRAGLRPQPSNRMDGPSGKTA